MVSQRDALLGEVEDLRESASKQLKAEIQEEFNQQFQQLANEKLSIVKEKNELEEKLKSIMAEWDGMKKTLQGNTEIVSYAFYICIRSNSTIACNHVGAEFSKQICCTTAFDLPRIIF